VPQIEREWERSFLHILQLRTVESESESEGILRGVGVGKNVLTPNPTSI
jgi:hypothetical protein